MFNNSKVRSEARAALGGRFFSSEWLYAIVVVFLVSLVLSVSGYIPLATIILSGPISMACAAYFLNRVRGNGRHDELGVLVDVAKDDFGTNIIISVLTGLYAFFWSLLFIIPGIVKAISYSMAYYVKRDNPNMTASQAITESRRLMDGYKGKFFLLQLSFFARYILGFLCLGIGALWVSAYNAAANAAFYENILLEKGLKVTSDSFTDDSADNGERPLWESVVNAPANDPWAAPAPANDPWAAPAPADNNGDGTASKSVNPDN